MGETGKESNNSEMNWRLVGPWFTGPTVTEERRDLLAAGFGYFELEQREEQLTAEEEQEMIEEYAEFAGQLPLWNQSELDQI